MKRPLTDTQAKALAFLRNYLVEHGHPPTRPEICRHMGYGSLAGARSILLTLAAKRRVEIVPRVPRGIRLIVGGVTPC